MNIEFKYSIGENVYYPIRKGVLIRSRNVNYEIKEGIITGYTILKGFKEKMIKKVLFVGRASVLENYISKDRKEAEEIIKKIKK